MAVSVVPEFSLVIPAYNEEARIESTLKDLLLSEEWRGGNDREILVVMDGCTDQTSSVVKEIFRDNNFNASSLVFPTRLGKGGAIIEALKHTKGQVIAFIDADGSIPISELSRLIELTKQYDLVVGSRYDQNSNIFLTRPLKRVIFSRSFNVFVKLLFWKLHGVNDTQCGVKVFSRQLFDSISKDLLITDFVFDVNLIYSALHEGFTVKEVGINWTEKEGGKFSVEFLKPSLVMALSLIRLRFHYFFPKRNINTKSAGKLYAFFVSWLNS